MSPLPTSTRGAFILTLLAASYLFARSAHAAAPPDKTVALISVLQSDAPLFDKARACQQLGETGRADAIPALARLLSDPKLSAFARSGLEGIPDPSAAAALRDSTRTLSGPLLAGAVNSLGVLRDVQAVGLLTQLASDPAKGVTKEALLALGNISTPEAILFLQQALASSSDRAAGDAAAACLLAADRLRRSGDLHLASALYDSLCAANLPLSVRVGATRGAILTRTSDRVPFLLAQLRSEEAPIRNAALLTVREIPDAALASALNKELSHGTPDFQRLLLLAVADCNNSDSVQAVQPLTDSPDPDVRKTAFRVLGRLGPSAEPVLITALQKDRAADEESIVLAALKELRGSGVDDQLVQALASASAPRVRVGLIRVLESRGAAAAARELTKQAAVSDKEVSRTALSALRSLAGPNELPSLISLARSEADPEARDLLEAALVALCTRSGDAASASVLEALQQSSSSTDRNCWISVLSQVGYPKALPAIEAAAASSDPGVADHAVRQLGHWPTPSPVNGLLKTLESATDPNLRRRAAISVIDLATTATDDALAPHSAIVQWLERAAAAADTRPEKLRVLGLLGRLPTIESFRLLTRFLEDSSVRTEAAAGIVQIAPALALDEDSSAVKTTLDKIAANADSSDVRDRAARTAKALAGSRTVSLFDGHSLDGWEGNTNVWRVENGLIVGGSLEGNPRNEFLATTRRYTNFTIRLEYKLVGTEGFVNSGVQFRSVRVQNPPNEMSGYQADIGAGYSGCLYDESRRNTFLVRAPEELIKRLEKPGDWNRYEVRADDRHIQLWLNGEKTVDYSEADLAIPQSGLIGLQIHGGNKAQVSFRNITIREP